jgi:hypothetical protein
MANEMDAITDLHHWQLLRAWVSSAFLSIWLWHLEGASRDPLSHLLEIAGLRLVKSWRRCGGCRHAKVHGCGLAIFPQIVVSLNAISLHTQRRIVGIIQEINDTQSSMVHCAFHSIYYRRKVVTS